jgi:hypothetical protein
MLDPLTGPVGYETAGLWQEEPHLPFGAAERRWPRRWPCRAGRSAANRLLRLGSLWGGRSSSGRVTQRL